MREETAVGDLNSNDQGTGARKNEGKLPMHFIPVKYWIDLWASSFSLRAKEAKVLCALSEWQTGNGYITTALEHCTEEDFSQAALVFEFGAKKYKEWNWAKGMPWSVPLSCILRHMQALLSGEVIDPDSGYSHWGHIVCNLIMLDWYETQYPDGDDRPPNYLKTS